MIISLEKLQALPQFNRITITSEHLDVLGHMNIQWYMAIFDDGVWNMFASIGVGLEFTQTHHMGAMALQQHLRYLAEVREGDTVTVQGRVLGRTAKRLHFMLFMINETQGQLAATLEAVGINANLNTRRSARWRPQIAANIDAALQESQRLDWPAPIAEALHKRLHPNGASKRTANSITPAALEALPLLHRVTVEPQHLDSLGHLNTRWYMNFYDAATWLLEESVGITAAYTRDQSSAIFILQQTLTYLAEVRLGETLSIRGRIIARNETRNLLASTTEMLGSHADLQARRTSPFPTNIAARIDAIIAEHQQLDWQPPLSGDISI